MALIQAKLSKESQRITQSKKLNIDFTKQPMTNQSAKLEIKKTKPSSAAVFKLDREALLPSVNVNIATQALPKEERKRSNKRDKT